MSRHPASTILSCKAKRPERLSCAGFTLVETLLVMGALAILLGVISSGFDRLSRSNTAENAKAGTQQNARIGVLTMLQDMRLAGLNPLGTAGAGIVAASPTSFQFTADTNFDGDTADPLEDLTYDLNGTNLRQTNFNIDPNPAVLLENVANLTFSYFDGTLAEIPLTDLAARLADIRMIGISLTANRPAGRNQSVARTYTTQIRLRNM